MYACYHCGRAIRGQVKHVIPPLYMQQLTGEGAKAYHPACYEKAEREAAEQFELASQPAKAWQRSTVEGGEV